MKNEGLKRLARTTWRPVSIEGILSCSVKIYAILLMCSLCAFTSYIIISLMFFQKDALRALSLLERIATTIHQNWIFLIPALLPLFYGVIILKIREMKRIGTGGIGFMDKTEIPVPEQEEAA